uniref:Uncharacterized protein n=1 Tax=Cucumis melo TaxID=3656 RepID=A0A9I9E7B1_CUCME
RFEDSLFFLAQGPKSSYGRDDITLFEVLHFDCCFNAAYAALFLRLCLFNMEFNVALLLLAFSGIGIASRPINLATTPGLRHTTFSPAIVDGNRKAVSNVKLNSLS